MVPITTNDSDKGNSTRIRVLVRGAALFLAAFALLNVVGDAFRPGFDMNLWWIDLRLLPAPLADFLVLVFATVLLAFALQPPSPGVRRWITVAVCGTFALIAVGNSVNFLRLLLINKLHTAWFCPFSAFVLLLLVLLIRETLRPPTRFPRRFERLQVVVACSTCALLLPLFQMFCFGKTDYRRQADITVVPGARVYADGRLSDALADRVRTACELYRQGLTAKLLMSGGPGDGSVDEPTAMKKMAVSLGVRSEDILLDHSGLNTQRTVRNSELIFAQARCKTIMVVSHFYHLPRLKLAYARDGREVYTVPAKESYLLRQMPFNMAREIAAVWVYYFRPLAVNR
jgi:uncharacterized SAM-binding protein YcdF (DUF218 family)